MLGFELHTERHGMQRACTCFFCGNTEMPVHKYVTSEYVKSILQRQDESGITDIVLRFSQNLLFTVTEEYEKEDRETWICICMCCYHWVERRKFLAVPPLPMQNLLWFMSTLQWYDNNKSDKRILFRLTHQICKPNNLYHACFLPEEIQGLRCIMQSFKDHQKQVELYGEDCTPAWCIKNELAKFYQRENGNGILLPNKQLADLLRPDYVFNDID